MSPPCPQPVPCLSPVQLRALAVSTRGRGQAGARRVLAATSCFFLRGAPSPVAAGSQGEDGAKTGLDLL